MPNVIFDLNEYSSALVGGPPEGFRDKILRAQELTRIAGEHGLELDDDVFLVAALAHYQADNSNPLAFVQRAKQVLRWLTEENKFPAQTGSLEMQRNKLNELARMVTRGLFKDEGFLLLVFDNAPGNVSYMASCERRDAIKMLKTLLESMVKEQAEKS